MADYTYQELMKMQNDAIRRAADMQQRAQKTAGLDKPKAEKEKTPVNQPKHIPMPGGYLETGEKEKKAPPKHPAEDSFSEKIKNGFGDVDIDSDKALLLSLIMLLSQEHADELLIMALIYMLT